MLGSMEYGQSAVGDLEHWALRGCVRAASALHAVCAVPRVHLPLPVALSFAHDFVSLVHWAS